MLILPSEEPCWPCNAAKWEGWDTCTYVLHVAPSHRIASISAQVNNLEFTDIFEEASPDDAGTCPAGFTSINADYAGQECLKLKPGMENVAPFLETRRCVVGLLQRAGIGLALCH
jgi:hypothetical protein